MERSDHGRRFPGWLVLLGALTAIGPLSIDMYLPAFPAMARELAADGGAIERTLSAFLIGLALGQLAYGPISDRYGRKAPLYAGLALFIVASLGCAGAPDAGELAAWRFLQAIGGGAGLVITRAIVRDRTDMRGAARAFSTLILVMGLAPILAPSLGSAMLLWLGWRGIFATLALFAAACLVAVHFTLTESLDPARTSALNPGAVLRRYGALLRHPRLMLYSLTSSLAMAGMFAYITGSPHVLIELFGVAPAHYGLVFGLNALGFVALSQLNGRLLASRSPDRILRAAVRAPALAGTAMLVLVLLGALNLPLLLLCLFAFISPLGFISPNASAIAMADQARQAGAASAILGTLPFTLGTLAGLAMSLVHGAGALPLACVMAACGVGSFLVYELGARRLPPPEPDG